VRRRRGERGQSLVEFSMIVTVAMLMLLGMLEFGFIFDHHLSLEYATREGARVAAALANGGGTVGCGTGQSPNAATVDQQIIAAVQRVVASPGSPIVESRIGQIRIYLADSTGAPSGSSYNTWIYSAGGGPVVDGKALDFKQTGSSGYAACSRDNGSTPDSIGVSITYTYQMVTPLAAVMGFFGGSGSSSIPINDQTVMALNPS
jgi:TadE-like protein